MKKYSTLAAASFFALLAASPVLADDNLNTSNVDQIGDIISATVIQEGTENINTSVIEQGLGIAGDTLTATVTQRGDTNLNDSFVKQDDENNTAIVLQEGTDNVLNHSDVTQTGSGVLNLADVHQFGADNTNDSFVVQNGGGLTAIVSQN